MITLHGPGEEVTMTAVPRVTPPAKLKIEKIAVLTDFSKNADIALRGAATFARGYKAGLVIAHAYTPPTYAFAAPEMAFSYQVLEDVRQSLESRLLSQTEAPFLRGINCTTVLHAGGTLDLLDDLADVDLIVVGTAGETGLEKAVLGSTAEAIFRASSIPVLTVGPHCHCSGEREIAVRTLLYATDFSPGAEIGFRYAASIVREHGAAFVLLHVKDDQDASFTFERAMASAEPLEKLEKLLADHADLKPRADCIVGFGAPEAVILEEAKTHKADLIVIGARGAGVFTSALSHFAGGTAYKVAARATCPVLTIRKA